MQHVFVHFDGFNLQHFVLAALTPQDSTSVGVNTHELSDKNKSPSREIIQ
jgi:hypothetical protein